MFKSTVFGALLAICGATAASAATLSFDGASAGGAASYTDQGFTFTPVRIVNGNCGAANPCLALNDNETTTITRVGGGTFSLTSLWFQLLGQGTNNTLTVTSSVPAWVVDLPESSYPHNNGFTIDFASVFANVTSITFTTASNGGNVRIDDLVLVPSQVPVPAAAGMLALALGGLGLAGRRKKA